MSAAKCPERTAHLRSCDLPARWRSEAEKLRPFADAAAKAFERAANDLERALQAEADDRLTLPQAAEVSGYSTDYLGRMLRSGSIPNAGRLHAPRIRRADLPRKAGGLRNQQSAPQLVGATPGEIARAVVTSQNGGGR